MPDDTAVDPTEEAATGVHGASPTDMNDLAPGERHGERDSVRNRDPNDAPSTRAPDMQALSSTISDSREPGVHDTVPQDTVSLEENNAPVVAPRHLDAAIASTPAAEAVPLQVLGSQTRPGKRKASIEPASGALARGALIGDRYVVLERLGVGGMGVVYKAYDPELDRRVAIKLLRVTRDKQGSSARVRLQREAQALAQLSHPNVITVYDVGTHGGDHVFVPMEFVEGPTLKQWLKREQRSLREILDVFIAAGRGLAAAHNAGLIHRDFKPDNVIVGDDGRVRVLDFGLVRSTENSSRRSTSGEYAAMVLRPGHQAEFTEHLPADAGAADADAANADAANADAANADAADAGASTVPASTFPVAEDQRAASPQWGDSPRAPVATIPSLDDKPAAPPKRGSPRAATVPQRPSKALSTPTQETDAQAGRSSASGRLTERERLLTSPLTMAGSIMGTPAYMAPEQYTGGTVDPRTDQFSFCVALYQALYGERPFAGRSLGAIRENVLRGYIKPLPADARVPAWLRQVVLRGLSVQCEQRYPSMDALLKDLQQDEVRRRRRARLALFSGAGVAVLATAVVAGVLVGNRDLCRGSEKQLSNIWNPDVKQKLRDGLQTSGRVHTPGTYERLVRIFDNYGNSWVTMRVATCEATHVHGEQSEQLLDLRMSCLSKRLRSLRTLTQTLADNPDGDMVDNALSAARQLPSLDSCAETALLDGFPLPEDPENRQRIEDIGNQLDDIDMRHRIGQFRQVFDSLKALAGKAEDLQFPPLQAKAKFLLGRVQSELDLLKDAETTLKQGAQLAAEARDDRLLAQVWIRLIAVLGLKQGRYDEAFALRPLAETAIARAGGDEALQADLMTQIGLLWSQTGRHDNADTIARQARKMAIEIFGTHHPKVSQYTQNLGLLLTQQGKYREARDLYQDLLELTEETCGSEHRDMTAPLNGLGTVLANQGEYEQALAYLQRAIDIEQANVGTSSPKLGLYLANIGYVQLEQGNYEQAEATLTRASALTKAAYGASQPQTADVLVRLVAVLIARGKLDAAEEQLQPALAIYEQLFGPEHLSYADALFYLATIRAAQSQNRAQRNRRNPARESFQRVLAIRQKALPADHPEIAEALQKVAMTQWRVSGRNRKAMYDQAKANLDRALTIWKTAFGPKHLGVAVTRSDMGELYCAHGYHHSATRSFLEALAVLESPELKLPGDHPAVARVLTGLGRCQTAMGEYLQAIDSMERAIAIQTARGGDPYQLARNYVVLARAYQGRGQHKLARGQARTARSLFRKQGKRAQRELRQLQTWMARLPR